MSTPLPQRSREHCRREGEENLKAGVCGSVFQNMPSRYDSYWWTRKEEKRGPKVKRNVVPGVTDMNIARDIAYMDETIKSREQ